MKRLLLGLGIALLLNGCGSLKFWDDEAKADGAAAGGQSAQADDDSAAEDAEEDEDAEERDEDELPDLPDFEEAAEFDREWSVGLGDELEPFDAMLRPVLAEGVVYAAGREGRVVAVDAQEGDRRWRVDLDTQLTGGVGAGAGLALVGTVAGDLVALWAETGEEAWRAQLSSEILAPAVAAGDIVVVQTQDAKVYGLAAGDGSRRWSFEADLPVLTLRGTATPVLSDNLVLVGFANGKLVALDLASGAPRWETRVAMPGGRTELERMVDLNSPVLGGDIVYAVSYQGRAGAYTRGSGRELWTRDVSSHQAPALGGNQLFVVDTEDRVIALRVSGGQQLWINSKLRGRKLSAPLAIGNLVAVADIEGYVHLLSATDGKLVGRRKVDSDGIVVPMAGQGNWIFVQDNSSALSAYRVLGAGAGEDAAAGAPAGQ